MEDTRADAKSWAKSFYRGLESTILPSFTADNLSLDEAGIRHDIRELIKHGFFSTVLITSAGTTQEEDKLFIQWCLDEAQGKIGIASELRYYSLQDNIEMARYAEAMGCDALLLSYPPPYGMSLACAPSGICSEPPSLKSGEIGHKRIIFL